MNEGNWPAYADMCDPFAHMMFVVRSAAMAYHLVRPSHPSVYPSKKKKKSKICHLFFNDFNELPTVCKSFIFIVSYCQPQVYPMKWPAGPEKIDPERYFYSSCHGENQDRSSRVCWEPIGAGFCVSRVLLERGPFHSTPARSRWDGSSRLDNSWRRGEGGVGVNY